MLVWPAIPYFLPAAIIVQVQEVGSSRKCKCHTSSWPISLRLPDFTPINLHWGRQYTRVLTLRSVCWAISMIDVVDFLTKVPSDVIVRNVALASDRLVGSCPNFSNWKQSWVFCRERTCWSACPLDTARCWSISFYQSPLKKSWYRCMCWLPSWLTKLKHPQGVYPQKCGIYMFC